MAEQNTTPGANSWADKGIELTEAALAAATNLMVENPDYSNKSLRLYLDGKGCDGFYYGVSFDDKAAEDIAFPQQIGGGRPIDLICDPDSLEFVRGSSIDWVDDERGRGFLVDNPRHRRFRGKFYKKKPWQLKLEAKRQAQQTQQQGD